MNKHIATLKNITVVNSMIARYLAMGYINKKRFKDPLAWRRHVVDYVGDISKGLLHYLNFDVRYTYSRPDLFTSGKNYFMVCNHMSYMDIPFLSAGEKAVFVTSVEMQNTPFLGDLAGYGGSYFVERRDRSKVPGEVKDLAKLMKNGFNVFVFPEGTSTHGMYILPFKKALFAAAVEAEVDVLPICLRYEMVDDEPFTEKNKDRLAWYGDMDFLSHFLQVMTIKTLRVTVNYLDPISVKLHPDRHELAQIAYNQISAKYFADRPPEFKPWPLPPSANR